MSDEHDVYKSDCENKLISRAEDRAAKVLVYFAAPYSHPDPVVRESRFLAINEAASGLMREGVKLFSPISHTHPIAVAGGLPTGFDYWESYDRAILACCCRLIVYQLDGWRESKGVKAEIEIAKDLGLEIVYMRHIPT